MKKVNKGKGRGIGIGLEEMCSGLIRIVVCVYLRIL